MHVVWHCQQQAAPATEVVSLHRDQGIGKDLVTLDKQSDQTESYEMTNVVGKDVRMVVSVHGVVLILFSLSLAVRMPTYPTGVVITALLMSAVRGILTK